ncbi:MAG: CRISPR-associated endonuclease Cas2 [Bacillota bacterium]|jgi:CRISPR-associated protein Cas2
MMVLITYDVDTTTAVGRKRLRQISRYCVNHGQRVQYSVFECVLDPTQFKELRHLLESIIDPNKDSLRYYQLGANWHRRVIHVGAKPSYDPEGPLII